MSAGLEVVDAGNRPGRLVQPAAETGDVAAGYLIPRIRKLQGPILILGGSGFIGANLLRTIHSVR